LGSLAASAIVAIALLFPTATSTLIPATEQISADITYGVSAPNAHYDLAVDPRPSSVTLTYQGSVSTTGQRTVADGTASGTLLLTNASTAEVTIAAGTTFTSASGVSFSTTDDVVVPAADPLGTRTFGSTEVGI